MTYPNQFSKFVMHDIEVKLTGRVAVRPVGGKVQELVEVMPVNEDDGTWKKWVPRSSLYEIQEYPQT